MKIDDCLNIVQHGLCKMSEEEYVWLHKLTVEASPAGASSRINRVVELGCFAGSGSVVLAGAAEEAGAKSLHIDIWEGDWGEVTMNLYQNQMRRAGQWHRATTLREDTCVAAMMLGAHLGGQADVPLRISMLVIDANHLYPYPLKDFEMWSPSIIPGGVVYWHDSVDEQVGRCIRELQEPGRAMAGWGEIQAPKAQGAPVTRSGKYHIPIPDNWMSRAFRKP